MEYTYQNERGLRYPANKVRENAFAEVLVTDGIDIADTLAAAIEIM